MRLQATEFTESDFVRLEGCWKCITNFFALCSSLTIPTRAMLLKTFGGEWLWHDPHRALIISEDWKIIGDYKPTDGVWFVKV